MKYTLLIVLTALTVPGYGQTDSTEHQKKVVPHLATIQTNDGRKVKGWLFKADEEHIYLLPASKKTLHLFEYQSPDMMQQAIPFDISNIKTIATQKKNAGLKGALIGLGAGAVTGVIAGFADGDDPVAAYTGTFADVFIGLGNAFAMTAEQKALGGGIALGLTGALTGYFIGKLAKKKFNIGGSKENYRDLQGDLMKRLIIK